MGSRPSPAPKPPPSHLESRVLHLQPGRNAFDHREEILALPAAVRPWAWKKVFACCATRTASTVVLFVTRKARKTIPPKFTGVEIGVDLGFFFFLMFCLFFSRKKKTKKHPRKNPPQSSPHVTAVLHPSGVGANISTCPCSREAARTRLRRKRCPNLPLNPSHTSTSTLEQKLTAINVVQPRTLHHLNS